MRPPRASSRLLYMHTQIDRYIYREIGNRLASGSHRCTQQLPRASSRLRAKMAPRSRLRAHTSTRSPGGRSSRPFRLSRQSRLSRRFRPARPPTNLKKREKTRSDLILFSKTFQGEEPPDTGGGRVFSLDVSCGLLDTASASALALFLGFALCCCGVSCMI